MSKILKSIPAVSFLALILVLTPGCGNKKTDPDASPASGTIETQNPVISPESTTENQSVPQVSIPTAPAASTEIPPAASSTPAASATTPSATAPSATAPSATAPSATAPSATGTSAAQAKHKLGELVFIDGTLTIHRKGIIIASKDIEIGDVVYPYDILLTGPKSKAEIDIASGSPGGATIKIAENTAFYFDSRELSEGERKTMLQLLSGAVAIKVDKLAGGSFNVATDTAVLGVRGTTFIVDTIPDGTLLLTCAEGAVAVQGNNGSAGTAEPGTAIVGSLGVVSPESVPLASLGSFRMDWRTEAYAAFGGKALMFIYSYAQAIDKARPDFDASYARLQSQVLTLKTWRDARAAGKVPRFTDYGAEKKAVAGVLFDCLAALFKIERPYYRLLELQTLQASGIGVGTLKDGSSSAAYFKSLEVSGRTLVPAMADIREALALFAWASAGSPLGSFFGSKAASLGSGGIFLGLDG